MLIEKKRDYWRVRINNPERRNALSQAVVEGLIQAADAVSAEPAVRAVILCAEGDKAFCAGADLKERQGMSDDEVAAFIERLHEMMRRIETSPKVWIAEIKGACMGGGLELALCADLRVAHAGAKFALPEARLGIIPGAGGTQRLPRLIGVAGAKALILTGRRIDAATALRMGLVQESAADAEAAAERWAAEVGWCAPISLTQAKRAIDGGLDLSLEAALAHERECYAVTIPTEDRLEGLRAFAEKRAPVFQGK
ncbi:enoyl-CoA hydratase/isomerase family protein [Myxococcota bacterium]|nr:enoyl-CoA hydratase/isomerase family protein [Myxococcota bacterium]MBU1431296.1 enoyl-CoA hydratase/isomerase family protein [Myxococcota bacterium]MBU1896943.1 enoyl-CoA hydratase/isomerase family protein [Myxococcota bacterium]